MSQREPASFASRRPPHSSQRLVQGVAAPRDLPLLAGLGDVSQGVGVCPECELPGRGWARMCAAAGNGEAGGE